MRKPIRLNPPGITAPERLGAAHSRSENGTGAQQQSGTEAQARTQPSSALSASVSPGVDYIVDALGAPPDLAVRPISKGVTVLYIENLADSEAVRRDLIAPLMGVTDASLVDEAFLMANMPVAGISSVGSTDAVIDGLLTGKSALVLDGGSGSFLFELQKGIARQISPPTTEPSVRGPRDAFTERLSDNIVLIRQRMRNRNLRVRELTVGRDTGSRVAVCYMEGKVSPDIVAEVIDRLSAADVSAVIDSSYLEPYITGAKWSLFPLSASTERSDRACAAMTGGRIVVLCDNSPFAILVPIQLVGLFQVSEDFYGLSVHSLLLRIVRILGWMAVTMAPGLYIGFASFDPGILPPSAVMTIAAARQGVPYPPVVEVLIMDVALEMLAEASIRLPTYVGGAATVVGGLILGTAAAQAKIVSEVMIIVVAITAIGSFLIPNYLNGLSWRAAKYVYTFSAAFLGIYGLATAALVLLAYLCSIDVLGTPYMSPFAPWRWTGIIKDTLISVPVPLRENLQRRQRRAEQANSDNE